VSYTTKDKVRLALARDLGEVQGTAASLEDPQIDDAIAEAQSRVDGRLGALYLVPFTDPAPALVQTITRDLAAFLADLTYREVRDYSSNLNPVYIRYQEALGLLKEIAEGKVSLPGAPGVVTPTGEGLVVWQRNQTDSPLITSCEFDLHRPWNVWP
jgi:phage gp36-like protein